MPQRENLARKINPSKPRIFLADLEYAKKEEWERRRKLRLKQVRQQARDIASVIRTQAEKARKHKEIVSKCEQLNAELVSEENKIVELENKLSECLTSVGTGHSSATILSEVDELVRHKTELQERLARVRAELAAGKAKETRKPCSEVAGNPREGISISKVTSGKPTVRPAVKKYIPAVSTSSSNNVPATPPNLVSSKRPGESAGSGESLSSQPVAEKTIFSPPLVVDARSASGIERRREDGSQPGGRKSCPPVTETVVADGVSSDSDSGQTWPPASVKKKKSSKVRMYDHSARKCTEYVQQCGVIRMETLEDMNMKELIQQEEDLLCKKTDEELENRRVELQRGVRALREEMAKQDWDSAITKLCQFAKEKRIKKSLKYPCGPDREEPQTSGRDPGKGTTAAPDIALGDPSKVTAQEVESKKYKDESRIPDAGKKDETDNAGKRNPPAKLPSATLRSIVSKFNRQRDAILNDQSLNEDSDQSESEDEDAQLPLWLRAEVEAQNSTVRESQDGNLERAGSPKTIMESLNGRPQQGQSSSSFTSSEAMVNAESSSPSSSPKGCSGAKRVAFQSDAPTDQPVSSRETSNSTSSGDVNVEIRFKKGATSRPRDHMTSEDSPKSSPDQKSSTTPPCKDSSSTSYCSPPDKLSPQQLSLLSGILARMSVKNRNPVLHHYINRVLEMSRQSVSELDVSSSSELSIHSDLFNRSRLNLPKPVQPVVRNLRFKEDNSSTAVSVSSIPRDSVGEASSSDNASEIAALLRNIVELQKLYRSATLSEPLSDSVSSYRSVPDPIVTDRCDGATPQIGPVTNFCEETGIFETQHNTDGQPMFYTIFDKDRPELDIPSELFPKPIFNAADRQPTPGNLERRFDDVPDGHATRPEHDPVSLKLPKRGIQKVVSSLSDLESEVSSIQSTPTKVISRRSTSPVSIAASDDKESTVSGISSSDFISSAELRNNDLIGSTPDSSTDFEDVFQSLGLGWALTTLRRIRNARRLPTDDSSSKTTNVSSGLTSSSSSDSKHLPSYRHSTPLKNKGCPKPIMESSENDAVPSLTPPNLTLLCPTLQK